MSSTHRFSTLDGMRGMAAFAVMFCHLTQHTSNSIFSNARLAVDLFFCLSGFVIAHSYADRLQSSMSMREYLVRRLIRLYPMFLIGLLLGTLALGLKISKNQTDLTVYQATVAIALNALYIPFLSDFYIHVGHDDILSVLFPSNDPSWSLSFEFIVNIMFGALIWTTRKRLVVAIASLGFLWLLAYVVITRNVAPGWGAGNFVGGLPRTVFGFFAGVALYLYWDKYKDRLPVIDPVIIVLLLTALLFKGNSYIWLGSLILIPPIVALGSISNPCTAVVSAIFEYTGWISYPVYCLHFPIYSIFTSLTDNRDYGLMTIAVCGPIVVFVSHLAAKAIEEPCRDMLAGRFLAFRR